MRRFLRSGLLAATLLLGLPAAALLVAHLGFIALPEDPFATADQPTAGGTAAGSGVGMRVLERLDTMPQHRVMLANIAVAAAYEQLPRYIAGLQWMYYTGSSDRITSPRAGDLMATLSVPDCAECEHGPRARLTMRARVVFIDAATADVTLSWTLISGEGRVYARGGVESGGREEKRGRITVRLRSEDGVWIATVPEPAAKQR